MATCINDSRRLAFALYVFTAPAVAGAYFDPGNGAFMVQTLFTLLGAGLFYLRHPVRLMRLIGARLKSRKLPGTSVTADNSESSGLEEGIVHEEAK